MNINQGDRVLLRIMGGGQFVGTVDRFERDGAVAVIVPTRDPVRDVFPDGYTLGRAHWDSCLTVLDGPE